MSYNVPMNFSHLIKQWCVQALTDLLESFPEKRMTAFSQDVEVSGSTQERFGHYQSNCALKLTSFVGIKSQALATRLKEILEKRNRALPSPMFESIETAGPGFLNFTLHRLTIAEALKKQWGDPHLGVDPIKTAQKVVIDFSSPNIAKEMHVGHLRSTIIGECLARVLSFLGYEVLRLNHIGDWGTQFGMLIAYLKQAVPEMVQESDGSHSSSTKIVLSDLTHWYRASKKLFDESPEFRTLAHQEVVALQGGESTAFHVWQRLCDISRDAYQEIYNLLGVSLVERGESFYSPFLKEVVDALGAQGLLTLSDGAQCVCLPDFINREGDPLPLLVQKSDGGYNYATTDLAALRHRVGTEKADWLIYVTDAGQSLHFQMVFQAAAKAGFYDPKKQRLSHVAFGLVLGADGKKFKTRSGETERLSDLLYAAVDKAKELLKAREKAGEEVPETEQERAAQARILGINAVKYADLSCNRAHDYSFSYERMLRFEGNTAAFIMYAYVRVRSIQKKVGIPIASLVASDLSLEEPIEIALGLTACQFSEVLSAAARDLMPHRLTEYLYKLASLFHLFFHQCRVEGSPVQNSRLRLCEAVASVLFRGMLLLGLTPLERM